MEHIIGGLVSIALVIVTTVLYYEILRITWAYLPKFKVAPRKRIIIVVLSTFAGHTLAVWIYALVYWFYYKFGLGDLSGEHSDFLKYLYFSAASYSSLGMGDIFPTEGLYIIVGVEALNGLVLIGWSVAFTFLAMQKFWDLHPSKSKGLVKKGS
jgi:hypothetical protein